jgi:hypothetical protein
MTPQWARGSAYRSGEFRGVGRIALLAALTLMVFIRRGVGWRLLRKSYLVGMCAFLWAFGWASNLSFSLFSGISSTSDPTMTYFGLAVLGAGFWQRRIRAQEERGGLRRHDFNCGVTYFDFLPVPDQWTYLVDGPVAFLAGLLLRYRLGFGVLGLWVCLSALAFVVVGHIARVENEERRRDMGDATIEALQDAEELEHGRNRAQREGQPATSIATGMDADIQARIERNRREIATAEGQEVQRDVA